MTANEHLKVKLPREVAEAIGYMRSDGNSNEDIVSYALGSANGTLPTLLRGFIKENGFDILLKALVNDYEVERTPEDKVRDYYNIAKSDMQSTDYDLNFPGRERVEAISYVLEALGIKIDGVNA